MIFKILILFSTLYLSVSGQCELCDAPKTPDTIWLSAQKFVILYVVRDTVETRIDTTFKEVINSIGLTARIPEKYDTLYRHSDFDVKRFQDWNKEKPINQRKQYNIFLK